MRQQLLHQADERTVFLSRAATIVLVLAFVGWLAWFGVTAPWDVSGHVRTVGDFFGRFAGLVILLAAIFAPLAIAAIAERRRNG